MTISRRETLRMSAGLSLLALLPPIAEAQPTKPAGHDLSLWYREPAN